MFSEQYSKLFLKSNFFYACIAGVLPLLYFYPILSTYLFAPNSHMYSFGGDALTIYYDIQYHVCHGSGTRFQGMNYPNGELIFLTDAQGALAMILQWINHYFPICDYVIGIINFLNAFSVLIASGLIYTILRYQGVSIFMALLFCPLITLLSPQIFRLGGHFGLAYLFLIPLVYLYIIRHQEKVKFTIMDFFMALILLFFTFNNPYMGFIGSSLLIFAGIFRWLNLRSDFGRLKIVLIGLIPLITTYIYFKLNDPVQDRIKLQWGYFLYASSPKGLIAPQGTLMDDIIKSFANGYHLQFETLHYIGIVSILTIILSLIFYVYKKFHAYSLKFNDRFLAATVASLILYLYSTGVFFLPFDQDFVEDSLGFLLMFKAVGRLGWPLYFAITFFVIIALNEFYTKTPKAISIPIIVLLAIIWNWDINTYVKKDFKDKIHQNSFSKKEGENLMNLLKAHQINLEEYQCLLTLPKLMTWTDNFICDPNWAAQFYSQYISRTTGIPILNAMLSRMSISQTAERIELLANPIVYKSLPDSLPNRKDILIVLGTDFPELSVGERFLIEIADTLYYKANHFSLHRLRLEDINNNVYLQAAKKLKCPEQNVPEHSFYIDFDTAVSPIAYLGEGAKKFEKGRHKVFESEIKSPIDSFYNFSVWTAIDHLKYGMGWFHVEVKDSTGNVIFYEVPDTRRSNEVHDLWIRTASKIPTPKNCTVKVEFETNRTLYIDELLIRPDNVDVVLCKGSRQMLINGFKVNL